jgi:tripartite-type tricarboxylate transporter receptor subunit TctC
VVNWFGLWMPAGAPRPVVEKVHAAVHTAVNDPEVERQFDEQGLQGVAMPPNDFARFAVEQSRIAEEIGRRVNRG